MLTRRLMGKRLGNVLQRERAVNHRLDTRRLDRAHHVALLAAAADNQPLQRLVAQHQLNGGHLPDNAGKHPLGNAGTHEIRVSPWRGLAFCGLSAEAAAPLRQTLRNEGLIVESDDPRLAVSACTGAPACTRGEAPALADAAILAEALAPVLANGATLHVSGCPKSCANPGSADLTLVGRDQRYDVIIDGGTSDTAIAHLSLTELVRRLEPGQDIRARLKATQH